jgi:hypothetical protein
MPRRQRKEGSPSRRSAGRTREQPGMRQSTLRVSRLGGRQGLRVLPAPSPESSSAPRGISAAPPLSARRTVSVETPVAAAICARVLPPARAAQMTCPRRRSSHPRRLRPSRLPGRSPPSLRGSKATAVRNARSPSQHVPEPRPPARPSYLTYRTTGGGSSLALQRIFRATPLCQESWNPAGWTDGGREKPQLRTVAADPADG